MPTPAYTHFDASNPQGSQTGPNFATSTLADLIALRNSFFTGKVKDYVFERTNGSGSADDPQFFYFKNASTNIWFRATNTWSSGKLTTQTWDWSNDAGASWAAVHAADSNTFDASYNVTASTQGNSFFILVIEAIAKVRKTITDLAAHIAGTGTGVHGLGSVATQSAAAVAITGGTINGTTLGASTAAAADVTRIREAFTDLGTIAGGGTATMDWSAAAHYSFTAPVNTANFTIAFSNLPAAGKSQGITFEIINGQRSSGVITYPANAKWIGGVATKPADSSLESAGRNLFVCFTRDGGTRLEIQHLGKGG